MDESFPGPIKVTRDFATGYAVVIGVANYRNVRPPLPEAVLNDARDVAAVLTSNAYCGYESRDVHLLLDGDATLARIRSALDSVAKTSGPDDTVVIFFSGHGALVGDPADPESAPAAGRMERTDTGDHEPVRDGILLCAPANLRPTSTRPDRRVSRRRRRELQGRGSGGITGSRLQREVSCHSGPRNRPRSDRVVPSRRNLPRATKRSQQRIHFQTPRCFTRPRTYKRGWCDPGLRDIQPCRTDGEARGTGAPAPDLQGKRPRRQFPGRARPGRNQVGRSGGGFESCA